ncbi:nuclear transport factor 2 family protein [Actinomarinicola tropica]|uniref:nuclear transport factor 2 family protein n=1 Tax=Actinomarinicola tropica TaxID=2789776 RepID=UPI001E5BE775|nr:nuclear transport factor 2 family protein [Actinomarinicola tropica]
MTEHRRTVERYFDGFRASDHPGVLSLLTDDVVWELPGFKHLVGKDAFDGEIENPAFEGPPDLDVDRVVEDGDVVVAIGRGRSRQRSGDEHRFAFCDVFTFSGDLIGRVESYVVPLAAD